MATDTKERSDIQVAERPERVDNGPRYVPAVDVIETDDALIFKADLPGVRQEDLNIRFDNGVLNIEARVQRRGPAPEDYLWREYGIGNFSRSFTVEIPVKADEIKATLKQGELKLHVPKAESVRTRRIPVLTS